MIKKILCMLIVVYILAAPLVMAEETEKDREGLIKLRGIGWYTSRAEVMNAFESQGMTAFRSRDIEAHIIFNPSDSAEYENRVIDEGGGCNVTFYSAVIAGYETYITTSFIYPIQEDGTLLKSDDEAQLYEGEYSLRLEDGLDLKVVFEDLKSKIASLYGEFSLDQEENSNDITAIWEDPEGNMILLSLLGNSEPNSFYRVCLKYVANHAQERFEEVKAALEAEELAIQAAEESERLAAIAEEYGIDPKNTDGL